MSWTRSATPVAGDAGRCSQSGIDSRLRRRYRGGDALRYRRQRRPPAGRRPPPEQIGELVLRVKDFERITVEAALQGVAGAGGRCPDRQSVGRPPRVGGEADGRIPAGALSLAGLSDVGRTRSGLPGSGLQKFCAARTRDLTAGGCCLMLEMSSHSRSQGGSVMRLQFRGLRSGFPSPPDLVHAGRLGAVRVCASGGPLSTES